MKTFALLMVLMIPPAMCLAEPGAGSPMFQNGPEHRGVYETGKASGSFKRLQWKFKTGGRIFSNPVVSDGMCFFGSEDKHLYAVAAATGRLRWKTMTGPERRLDEWDFYLSSPCPDRGVLYCGGGDGRLHALDMKTGKALWQFETPAIIHASPAVSGDTVYFGNCEGACYAVDLKTRALKWRFKTEPAPDMPKGEIIGSPAVCDGVVYIGSKNHTGYALNAESGEAIWKARVSAGWVISTPAVKDGIVCYGRTGDFSFHGMDAAKSLADGNPRYAWHFNAGMYFFTSAAIAGDTVYIGCFNGILFALDLQSGAEKWRYQLEGSLKHWDDFYRENQFTYATFSRFDGKGRDGGYDSRGLIDALFTMGSITGSPCAAGDMVYFGSADGHLYALKIE